MLTYTSTYAEKTRSSHTNTVQLRNNVFTFTMHANRKKHDNNTYSIILPPQASSAAPV